MPRLLAALAALALAAPAAAQPKPVRPIEVVTLDRKDPVSYEKEVEPVLVNKCNACHSGGVVEGKFDMGTYAALMKGGKKGPAVVPGKSTDSRLAQLAGKTHKPYMPPKGDEPLTPQELALVKLWIDQGARPPAAARERAKVTLSLPPAGVTPVRAVAVRADKGAGLVVAGRGNQVHAYDAKTGAHLRAFVDPEVKVPAAHLSLVESLALSPDGQTLASGGYQEVTLWDVAGGVPKRKLTGFADRVVTLAFSPDGKRLAAGGGAPTEDGEVKVFDAESGAVVADLKGAHSDTVFGVAFSPDGSKLATCGADKFVKVFEVPAGKFVKSFEGHTHHVMDVSWKADGKVIASAGADDVIKVWDFEKGEQVRTIKGMQKQVTRLAFIGASPTVVTAAGDQSMRVVNVENGGIVRAFAGGSFLYAAAASADGGTLAAGGEDGVVRLYAGNGQLIKAAVPPGEK